MNWRDKFLNSYPNLGELLLISLGAFKCDHCGWKDEREYVETGENTIELKSTKA